MPLKIYPPYTSAESFQVKPLNSAAQFTSNRCRPHRRAGRFPAHTRNHLIPDYIAQKNTKSKNIKTYITDKHYHQTANKAGGGP